MNAKQMWDQFGQPGDYEAWQFGDDADALAELVLSGKKIATSSAYLFYETENEPVPKAGEYSVVLNSQNDAVCIIETTSVKILPFDAVTQDFAAREGEGDRSLAYWRSVHKAFFAKEMAAIGAEFDEKMLLVCEEFKKVFP